MLGGKQRPAEGVNGSLLTRMTTLVRKSHNNHRMTYKDLPCGSSESFKARKKPFINKKDMRYRLRFTKIHKDCTVEGWIKVIFSDESTFQLFPAPVVQHREAFKPLCLTPVVKSEKGSVMSWGCFSKARIGLICLCGRRMNRATDKADLIENFLPFYCSDSVLQQSVLVPHKRNMPHTKQPGDSRLENHNIKTMSLQSPELNPIANI